MTEVRLALEHIGKSFGRLVALSDISLQVPRGMFLSLLGPSGCGKTTLLRVIAGILAPDGGRVVIDGSEVTRVPTYRRNMGMVFQSFALFPHLSVADNVAFPLKCAACRGRTGQRVAEALRMVHLDALAERYPRELSGGQQQRVGLARAIVYRPTILLLDEPLSNLDASLREEMRLEISQVHAPARHHRGLCHPRSARGIGSLGCDRRDVSWTYRAIWHAGADLSSPGQRLHRPLRWLCE